MKKDKADKKEKKERKEGKKQNVKDVKDGVGSSGSSTKLTHDELLRLDEVRRSLKIRTRRKEKEKLPSGITADYTANFNLGLAAASGASVASPDDDAGQPLQSPSPLSGSNSETSLNSVSKEASGSVSRSISPSTNAPVVPPSRGILKGKSSYGLAQTLVQDLEDDNKLVENTLRNELIIYEKPPTVLSSVKRTPSTLPKLLLSPSSSSSFQANGALPRRPASQEPSVYSTPRSLVPLDAATAASIAAETGLVMDADADAAHARCNGDRLQAAPGEGYGWSDHSALKTADDLKAALHLPPLIEPTLPEPRDLTLVRKETGDFGFSLRRSVVVERCSHLQPSSRYFSAHLVTVTVEYF